MSTIPWDSYLIRNKIWTYPPNAIVGPTLLDIPAEEVFFFIIQTYTTSLLYLILNKATFHSIYLRSEREKDLPQGSQPENWRFYKYVGQFVLVLGLSTAWVMFNAGGTGTYMGLIVGWAFPFLLFLWYAQCSRVSLINANMEQDPGISIPCWTPVDKHSASCFAAYVLSLGC